MMSEMSGRMSRFVPRSIRQLAFAALAFTSLSGSARADWQYTRWGMSPQQVLEAAGGAAKAHHMPSDDGPTQRSKVVAPYRSGEHLFRSRFVFDLSDNLIIVMLELSDLSKCPELYRDLTSAYGPPQSFGSGRSLPKWWDKKNGNVVLLIDTLGSCSIQYTPIVQAGAPGGL